jgi:hypothetical protein
VLQPVSVTTSLRVRAENLGRSLLRQAPLLRALSYVGLLSIACTLTQEDYEPNVVFALESAPDAGASDATIAGVSGVEAAGCMSGAGCCTSAADCADGAACVSGVCSPTCPIGEDVSVCAVPLCPGPSCPNELPSCSDGITDGREPATDCGDSCPRACQNGSACNVDRDCESLRCSDSRCAPPVCDDGIRNQDESAVDCGGGCPTRCSVGESCAGDSDCEFGLFCPPATEVCTDGSCQDGARSGNEVLADCGGGDCPGCPAGSPCNGASDCLSRVCSDGQCREASCSDGVSSGDESGIDCGGSDPNCAGCADGAPCRSGADCESSDCENGICISCSDGRRNGSETGVDCGGPDGECARCGGGVACSIDLDCASGDCAAGECFVPRCDDGVRNGSETDADCGGDDVCPRCAPGDRCALDSDCANQSCDDGVCASCGDGVRNGSETAVDCGGADPTCSRCAPGLSCQVDGDCASGACQGGTCCGGNQVDCTRCAERLSAAVNCDFPTAGTDPTGVSYCNAFLGCLSANPTRCPTRNTPGCSGDDQVNDACPHNNFGGNAGTGLTRANQVLQNAGCQL